MSHPHDDIVPIALPTPFIVGPVNVFLLRRDQLTLVDVGCGTDDSYDALANALADLNLRIADIEVILITHGHIDHIGLLGRLVAESGATTYAHASVTPHAGDYQEAERRSREFLMGVFRDFGVPQEIIDATSRARESFKGLGNIPKIDHILRDGDSVFGLDVLHVPGHSSSDTLFVDSARRLAFSGDHVLKGVNPTPLIRRNYETGERVRSLLEYEHSLARTRSLGLETVYPGHGPVITNPGEVIDRILDRHERRTQKVLDHIKQRPATPFEVGKALFPELSPEHTYLALSTAIGHLDILEKRGEVHIKVRDGVHYYHAALS